MTFLIFLAYIFSLPYKAFLALLITILTLANKPIPRWIEDEAHKDADDISDLYDNDLYEY